MTTQTLTEGTIQAKDGLVGSEYQWVDAKGNAGARTLLAGVNGAKVVVKFWVEGHEFNTQAHTVPGTQLLKIVDQTPKKAAPTKMPAAQNGQASAQPKAAASAQGKAAAAPKPPKAVKVKKDRIPKKAPGEKTPRVELLGFSFRKDYRSRLSPLRALECQKAIKDSCHCRCAGSLHGLDHKPWFDAENALFEKSPNGAITALQVLNLVKQFGGVKLPKPKPRGRKALTPEQIAEREAAAAAKVAVKAAKAAEKEAMKATKLAEKEALKVQRAASIAAAEAAKIAAKAPAAAPAKAAVKTAPVKAQVKPQAKPVKTSVPK